jgi:hypothetical protein
VKAEEYTPERIQAAIEFVRHRMATSRKKISAPGRYLMKAIQEGWSVPTSEVAQAQPAGEQLPAVLPRSAPAKRRAVHEQQAADALQRDYQEQGERGYELYLAAEAAQRAEWRASFARTLVFRVLSTQLQRAKGPVTEPELRDTPRLRHAFGQHVLKVANRAGRSGIGRRETTQESLFIGEE